MESASSNKEPLYINPPKDEVDEVIALFEETRLASGDPFEYCYKLPDGRFVKSRTSITLKREAAAMEYVRTNSNIPVPQVCMLFHRAERWYLVMDAAMGTTLRSQYKTMPFSDLESIGKQLHAYVLELQKLGSECQSMGSWPEGSFSNVFFDPATTRFLPDAHVDLHHFHSHWQQRVALVPAPKSPLVVEDMEAESIVFAHGDLNASSIIISGQNISAIIDWDTLGWYPSFWEAMSMHRGGRASKRWRKILTNEFGPLTPNGLMFFRIIDFLADNF